MDGSSDRSLRLAASDDDWRAFETLVREYAESLGIDLDFQNYDAEIARLRAVYGPPHGAALLAALGGDPVGCAGVRRLGEGSAELKRMYVRPPARGHGVGRALAAAAVAVARDLGYRRVRLDTLESMTAAIALYRSLGFREIAPYRENPHPARYLELEL